MSQKTSLVALRYQPSQRFGYLFPTKYAESENNRYRVSFGRQRGNQATKQDRVDTDVLLTSCGVLNLNSHCYEKWIEERQKNSERRRKSRRRGRICIYFYLAYRSSYGHRGGLYRTKYKSVPKVPPGILPLPSSRLPLSHPPQFPPTLIGYLHES